VIALLVHLILIAQLELVLDNLVKCVIMVHKDLSVME
jgi:hypothetical protein